MELAANILVPVAWIAYIATVIALPYYAWRSWSGFFIWLFYAAISLVILVLILLMLHPLSDEPALASAAIFAAVGTAISAALLRIVARLWRQDRKEVALHPWFGDQPPI